MAETVDRWMREAATTERVPANLYQHLAEEPHTTIIAAAGLMIIGEYEFAMPYEWSVEKLTGFMYSTSILSQQALGSNVAAFECDLRAATRHRTERTLPRGHQLQLHAGAEAMKFLCGMLAPGARGN